MKRVALLVQYDGTNYSGWQKQKNATTIQQILDRVLFTITNNKVKTFAAGRTDAGVHASGQVVHFDTNCIISLKFVMFEQCFQSMILSLIWLKSKGRAILLANYLFFYK